MYDNSADMAVIGSCALRIEEIYMAVAGEVMDNPEAVPAAPAEPQGPTGFAGFVRTPLGRNLMLSVALAAVLSIAVGIWLYAQAPEYRVLFANVSDRDGGAIVASLQQMNVPYKYSDGGNAILIPANQVYDVRLKLASQGLPKGGNVGFELMENQKLGISQFLEQVNYQRALEGELARSIESLASVQNARVHLALPKSTVFVRDQQKPTASVVLNLHPGRVLGQEQVNAIVHLVASSVPELQAKSVTLVDQNGNLLSENNNRNGNPNGLDPAQLKYVQDLQQSIAKRVEAIIAPIVGESNVRAEATADVDFSQTEQAAEIYKPNQAPNTASVRSEQTSESQSGATAQNGGVPGALSNQPPAPATAPIANQGSGGTPNAGMASGSPSHKEAAINYEVDKTVRYVQQPMGGLKRLSVAVVVNYRKDIDKNGKVSFKPLTDAEKTQITDLVKEAMGYNKDRGDTLNVANSLFAGSDKDASAELPLWKQPAMIELAMQLAKYLLIAIAFMYLFFAYVKPILKTLINGPAKAEPTEAEKAAAEAEALATSEDGEPGAEAGEGEDGEDGEERGPQVPSYQEDLDAARDLARTNPKVVANIVKGWVGGNNE